MTTLHRPTGITIESDEELVVAAPLPPVRGTRGGRAAPREDALLLSAMLEADMELVDAVPIAVKKPAGTRAGPRGQVRVNLKVPRRADEQVVVLLEEDGVYRWVLADEQPRSRGGAVDAGGTASFSLDVVPGVEGPGAATRGSLLGGVIRGAIAYVLKFVAKVVGKALVDLLEKKVEEGLVGIASSDPASWRPVEPQDVRVRASPGQQPRLLLFVHGTFSSTVGSFGALHGTREGRDFLDAALGTYDAVLGFDHRTLGVDPLVNATALLKELRRITWPAPPRIDVVAFSRGGLVARTLIEMLLPGSGWAPGLGPAVFVGCTNGGTVLADSTHWKDFTDHYTNLALGGLRVISKIPGATPWSVIAAAAVRGIGVLVKALAKGALDLNGVPGLAAMQPDGPYVKRLNQVQPGQVTAADARWHAITANFEPRSALDGGRSGLSTRLLQTIIDAAADALYREENDLVVHVPAMTKVDSSEYFDNSRCLHYGKQGEVYHTNYFTHARTAQHLHDWLLPGVRASAVRGGLRGAAAPAVRDRIVEEVESRAIQVEQAIDGFVAQRMAAAEADVAGMEAEPARRRKAGKKVNAKAKAKAKTKAKAKAKAKARAKRKKKSASTGARGNRR